MKSLFPWFFFFFTFTSKHLLLSLTSSVKSSCSACAKHEPPGLKACVNLDVGLVSWTNNPFWTPLKRADSCRAEPNTAQATGNGKLFLRFYMHHLFPLTALSSLYFILVSSFMLLSMWALICVECAYTQLPFRYLNNLFLSTLVPVPTIGEALSVCRCTLADFPLFSTSEATNSFSFCTPYNSSVYPVGFKSAFSMAVTLHSHSCLRMWRN